MAGKVGKVEDSFVADNACCTELQIGLQCDSSSVNAKSCSMLHQCRCVVCNIAH